MLIKLNARLRRDAESGASLVETVVAVAIIVLCLTLAGMALAAALQASNQSSDLNKAYQLINKQFAIARQVPYDKLGLVTSEANAQLSLVQTTLTKTPCKTASEDCSDTGRYQTVYNRQVPPYTTVSPGGGQPAEAGARIAWCGDQTTNPSFNATANYNGERRVVVPYSNRTNPGTANSDDPTDPASNYTGDPNATPQYLLYCGWYQYGQGNGDKMFLNRTTNNPSGGLGTIFVVETDVTWVDGGNFDGVNSNAANCYTGSTNCYMAKRVTTTVRWINTNTAGVSQLQTARASFVRAPAISDCAPVADNNFSVKNDDGSAAANPTPAPTASGGYSGVSCG